ncbi:MAG: Hint domain-containing protein [Pseudomonadota bacterium]
MALQTLRVYDNAQFTYTGTTTTTSGSYSSGDPLINNSDTPNGMEFIFTGAFAPATVTIDDTSPVGTETFPATPFPPGPPTPAYTDSPDRFDDDSPGNHLIDSVTPNPGGGSTAFVPPAGVGVESESVMEFTRLVDDGFGGLVESTDPEDIVIVYVFSRDDLSPPSSSFQDIWGMSSDKVLIPGETYRKTNGGNNGTSVYYSDFVPCFVAGTMIATNKGPMRVEDLKPGHMVLSRDHGFKEIAWAGKKTLNRMDLQISPELRPIRIKANALGKGSPSQDLVVSPNHRMLVSGPEVAMNFGTDEVLVPAKFLLHRPGIDLVTDEGVTYHHILFDRHEVVLSNECWTESFLPGDEAMKGIGFQQNREIYRLFPELKEELSSVAFRAARQILKRKEAVLAL